MSLICKIIEQKGEKVLVEIENQKLLLSTRHFGKNLPKNGQCRIYFLDDQAQLTDKTLAKEILEEILNGK